MRARAQARVQTHAQRARARVNSTCAGELGSADAWRNLASMYAKGEGTEPSEQTAKYLLELAGSLKKGDLDAMT